MTSEFTRQKTHASGSLTDVERNKIVDLKRLWAGRNVRTKPIDRSKIAPAIVGIYAAAGMKPPHIAIAASPLALVFAYGAAAAAAQTQNQRPQPGDCDDADTVLAALERMAYVVAHGERPCQVNETPQFSNGVSRLSEPVESTEAETHIAVGSEPQKHREEIYYRPSPLYTEVVTEASEGFRISAWRDTSPIAAVKTAASRRISVRRARELRKVLEAVDGSLDTSSPVKCEYLRTNQALETRFDQQPSVLETEMLMAEKCHSIAGQQGLKAAKSWHEIRQGGDAEFAKLICLTAFRDVLGLELASHKNFAHWVEAALEGDMRVAHSEFCIVCDFPEVLKLDEQGRPHCSDGPSHRWQDGWALYHWHGARVPQSWIEDKKSLTPALALSIHNSELRQAALEIVGWHVVLRALGGRVIAEDPDPQHGKLVDLKLPGDRYPTRFLHVECGTGRAFALVIPRRLRSIKGAHAWLTGLPARKFRFPTIRT